MLTVVALAGIWTAVPDTEAPLASVCVLAPLSVFYLLAPRTPGPVGSLALVATVVGAVWTGSAGWGSALATVGAVGLIAPLPLVAGFNTPSRGGSLGLLVAMQIAAGALLPRFVISRSVPVAVGVMVVANVSMLIVDAVALRRDPGAGEPRVPDGV